MVSVPLLTVMLRLMVWVTGAAGFVVKPMLSASVMSLPFSTKAPAAASNGDAAWHRDARIVVGVRQPRGSGEGQCAGEAGCRIPVAGRAPIIIIRTTGPSAIGPGGIRISE